MLAKINTLVRLNQKVSIISIANGKISGIFSDSQIIIIAKTSSALSLILFWALSKIINDTIDKHI